MRSFGKALCGVLAELLASGRAFGRAFARALCGAFGRASDSVLAHAVL